MAHNWTFGQKIGAGFVVTVALAITVGVISLYSLRNVVASKDRVILIYAENITDAANLATAGARATAAGRGFLLDKNEKSLQAMNQYRGEYQLILLRLSTRVATDEERALLSRIARADGDYSNSVDRLIALRKIDTPAENIARVFEEETQPLRQVELQAMDAFIAVLQSAREAGKAEAAEDASFAISLVWVISVAMALVAGIVAFVLIRALGQQVGTAVGQIQISSDVLQEAASKQSTGAKEKVMVMHEITTTIKELLASSRQIAENAQRVASVAEQAVSAARSGDGTVQQATQSIEGIRRQVDLIVGHMLELGKKSQQIGSVLGIVSELAEQTNILAINATIEAVGAGETGRRFAVVAEEIRKLADRIAGSTKEIHGMIEDVRGAVNTTVMATEAGSKAVDAGNQKFSEVAASFKQIAGLVSTTTEAAREIELSTKQQASAVEQVNGAIANVVQATLETEEIAIQTRKTGFQLAQLSGELSRLVQPQTSA